MAAGQTLASIPLATSAPESVGTPMVEHMMALARRYGPIFQLQRPGPRAIVITTFALADEVCDDQRFDKVGAGEGSAIRLLAGDGLFTAWTQEPNWHKAHSILLPNFSMQAMRSYLPDMYDLAQQLVLKWARLNADDTIDVVNDMTHLTLDTIGLCGFGYRFNSFYREDMHLFIASLNRVLTTVQQAGHGERLFEVRIDQPSQQLQDDLAPMNALVDAPARSGRGRYQGTCSNYLKRQPPRNAIYAFTRSPQMKFCPPEDPPIPIIMVGPGTGVAPFRGFLQERAALKQKGAHLGRALLFYGCRNPEDAIYQNEMQAWAAQGVVDVYTAFSRIEVQPKTYVQDQIKAHTDEVWQLIEEGAVVYVCGDAARMEPDVHRALIAIYQAKTGASAQDAEEWLTQMTQSNRYLADVWAGA